MVRFFLTVGLAALIAMPVRAQGYWAGEGYVVPKDGLTLRVRSTQLVSKVVVDIGDRVKKGDILLQFDDRTARIDMQIAQLNHRKRELELKLAFARMEVAKASVSRVQADSDRLQKIGVSKEELSKKEAELAAARAELAATEFQVELAKVEVETAKAFVTAEESKIAELSLQAPFDGTIVARYTTVGEFVKPEQGLLDMVGGKYLIEAPVPSRLLSQLKDKTPIEIALDVDAGEKTFKSQVALIGPVIDPRTKTVKVQFAIPESEMKEMKPGLVVTVKIGTRKKEDE